MDQKQKDELLKIVGNAQRCRDSTLEHVIVYDAISFAFLNKLITFSEFETAMKYRKAGAYLDAAAVLVPKSWCWMAGHRDYPIARAHVNNGELHMSGKSKWFETTSSTPAVALAVCSLRALDWMEDQKVNTDAV
jgi:hypothetical protein